MLSATAARSSARSCAACRSSQRTSNRLPIKQLQIRLTRCLSNARWISSSTGHRRDRAVQTAATNNGSDSSSSSTGEPSKLSSASNQQALQYVALAFLHTVLAACTTLAPNWSLQHLFGFKATTATSLQLVNAGAYLWLFASCLICLKDAALHNRLQSDTYKRLNLGLMYQSVIVIVLMLRHKAILADHVFGCNVAVFAATSLVAGRAYAASAGGLSLPTIVTSLFRNIMDLFQPKGLVSAFYAVSAGLTLWQFLWHYPTPTTPLFATDLGPVALLLKQARGAGMVLAGVVWYTLKDAADRGRLAASTFKQLNLGMAILAALQLWGLLQMHYMGVPLNYQLWKSLMATGVAVVVVCDWQYFFARKQTA